VTLRITALSYWQQFPAARVLLPHAELHHLSTSINGRRRYRLDQSTSSPAAIARRSPTQCRRPRTPPRKLSRSSHESSHAPLALYPSRASHLAFYHHPELQPGVKARNVLQLSSPFVSWTSLLSDRLTLTTTTWACMNIINVLLTFNLY